MKNDYYFKYIIYRDVPKLFFNFSAAKRDAGLGEEIFLGIYHSNNAHKELVDEILILSFVDIEVSKRCLIRIFNKLFSN